MFEKSKNMRQYPLKRYKRSKQVHFLLGGACLNGRNVLQIGLKILKEDRITQLLTENRIRKFASDQKTSQFNYKFFTAIFRFLTSKFDNFLTKVLFLQKKLTAVIR